MQDRNKTAETGIVEQILNLNWVPTKNVTSCRIDVNDRSLCDFSEMWYGVFLWTVVSSLVFHLPAAVLGLNTLRRHKTARFFPIAILLMGIIGPLFGGVLTSAAIAGVYMAAGKKMFSLEALVFGVGQSFFVLMISFLRVLATL